MRDGWDGGGRRSGSPFNRRRSAGVGAAAVGRRGEWRVVE
jgi:hypothetical protein